MPSHKGLLHALSCWQRRPQLQAFGCRCQPHETSYFSKLQQLKSWLGPPRAWRKRLLPRAHGWGAWGVCLPTCTQLISEVSGALPHGCPMAWCMGLVSDKRDPPKPIGCPGGARSWCHTPHARRYDCGIAGDLHGCLSKGSFSRESQELQGPEGPCVPLAASTSLRSKVRWCRCSPAPK